MASKSFNGSRSSGLARCPFIILGCVLSAFLCKSALRYGFVCFVYMCYCTLQYFELQSIKTVGVIYFVCSLILTFYRVCYSQMFISILIDMIVNFSFSFTSWVSLSLDTKNNYFCITNSIICFVNCYNIETLTFVTKIVITLRYLPSISRRIYSMRKNLRNNYLICFK